LDGHGPEVVVASPSPPSSNPPAPPGSSGQVGRPYGVVAVQLLAHIGSTGTIDTDDDLLDKLAGYFTVPPNETWLLINASLGANDISGTTDIAILNDAGEEVYVGIKATSQGVPGVWPNRSISGNVYDAIIPTVMVPGDRIFMSKALGAANETLQARALVLKTAGEGDEAVTQLLAFALGARA